MTVDFVVTTGRKANAAIIGEAKKYAALLQASYADRSVCITLEDIKRVFSVDKLLVITAKEPQIITEAGTFFYHPGMAVLRLQRIKQGEKDHFAEALALRPGMRVLDATLGLAADAAIASYITGASGTVVGLEASRLLHFVVERGLRSYVAEDDELTQSLRRIKTLRCTAEDYLTACADNAFDAVYFDPMFKHTVKASSAMGILKPLAYEKPLTERCLELGGGGGEKGGIKERSENVLRAYGCTEILGGRYSRVKFGVIRR